MREPGFKDHFSVGSADYAAHRPTYPAALVDHLAGLTHRLERALDTACGTGQLSTLLAGRFREVVATDASAAQIANAAPHPGVRYAVAPAERSGLPGASVDLVTVAQAAHWLDLDAFYAEVRRVGRPGGVLALISYGVLEVEGAANPVVQDFYASVLDPYWPPERRHVEEGYANLPFPFPECHAPDLWIAVSWALPDLLGYVSTWSAVRAAERALGTKPVETFRHALSAEWGDPQLRRDVRWRLSARIGRL
ncbi:class I SAM-dependent methyltransferase [Methylobacterium durans]|uniref:SAM-dependent methyltransferase n=1 Tax=Methylobacterium durans TaxID=2202825 RepID=A0A2U8W0T1_9HYPH|nr:class I SAM-dependent methyltransferase [Methylobacterium durans]AWN39679.1 SAM-dependent methyltransferase [Methylobacterium durans]